LAVAGWLVWAPQPARAIVTAQNDFYVVHVAEGSSAVPDSSIGSFQAHTGPAHPTGDMNDINFASSPGNVNVGTGFSGIRLGGDDALAFSYGGSGDVNDLDPFFSSEGPTPGYVGSGWRTVWDLFTEQIEIVQDVIVVGSNVDAGGTVSGAAIYHTVLVTSGRASDVSIEWLNLEDWATKLDDGPSSTIMRSGIGALGSEREFEFSHAPSFGDEFVRVRQFEVAPFYAVRLSLSHDPGLLPLLQGTPLATTTPDEYKFVQWETAWTPGTLGQPFDVFGYVVDADKNVASDTSTTPDSAGISTFSAVLEAGRSLRFTQVLRVVPQATPVPDVGYAGLLALAALLLAAGLTGAAAKHAA
jgi:hypothetical protein